MRITFAFALGAVVLLAPGSGHVQAAGRQQPAKAAQPRVSPHRALLDQYCVTCHNQRMKASGNTPIALDTLDLAHVTADAESWERVVRKLRAGLMPPAGRPRPDKAVTDGFAAWLETALDRAAAAHPNPGRTEPFHRLNRAEYQNAVRDLLELNVDVASLLPADDVSDGFDNIAERADDVADADGSLPGGGAEDQPACGGHAACRCRTSTTSASPTISARTITCRACRSARAAARRFTTRSRRTASTRFASSSRAI